MRQKQFSASLHDDGKITSRGLRQHFLFFPLCEKYYKEVVYTEQYHAGFDGLNSSRVDLHPELHGNRLTRAVVPRFTPQQLGLTSIIVSDESSDLNLRLDNHVMYDGTSVGPINRKLIDMEVDFDRGDVDEDDDSESYDLEEDDLVVEPNSVPHFTIATPTSGVRLMSDNFRTEIHLLSMLRKHKAPLCLHKEIYKWAFQAQLMPGFDWGNGRNPYRSRAKVMDTIKNQALPHLKTDDYDEKLVSWLPKQEPKEIVFRTFENALRSLLTNTDLVTQKNMSFPNADSPFLYERKPAMTDETSITELHHGSWWIDTWKQQCDPGHREVLVPLIFYMDGISVDKNGRNTLTPLNMSLGIFGTEARKRRDAWETLYFHPSSSDAPRSIDNIQNLHNGIEAGLQPLIDIWKSGKTIRWDGLPWANKIWDNVSLKFAVSFFIGDTEMHDKLCGRYGSRSERVRTLCRHCNCPINWSHIPSKNDRNKRTLYVPTDINTDNSAEVLRQRSYHPIRNVFHAMDFGTNLHNIHLASPGEKLHMHQLGAAKRALESFTDRFCPSMGNLYSVMNSLCSQFGTDISRQSDRDFPRTKFSSGYLSVTKKEGNDYSGLIISLVLSLLSTNGVHAMRHKHSGDCGTVRKLVSAYEQVLGMEEFLKNGSMKLKHVKLLPRIVANFLNEINTSCYRSKGMGQRLIKHHLYFHLQDYIELWGSPAGWDSSACEGHHKTEIKAPSKSTQCNKSTFIEQTAGRQLEYRLLDRMVTEYSLDPPAKIKEKSAVAGAHFYIGVKNTETYMKWVRKENDCKRVHPAEVLNFCSTKVLPLLSNQQVKGFTEHRRKNDNGEYLFRASPAYRQDSGQQSGVWYDWCTFLFEESDGTSDYIPCQLLCFLDLEGVCCRQDGEPHSINSFVVDGDGLYVIVRKFKVPAIKHPYSTIVTEGELDDKLYLFPIDAIEHPLAVVKNRGEGNKYFVVGNRSSWLKAFIEKGESLLPQKELYRKENCYPVPYPSPFNTNNNGIQ